MALISSFVWDIPGTTLSTSALEDPSNSNEISFAWSGVVPPPSVSPTLLVYAPPTVTVPATLTPTQGQITWAPVSNQQVLLMDLDRHDDAGAAFPECQVVTFGDTLDLARLAALGVTIDRAWYQIVMWGYGRISSLDALLDEGTLAVPDGTQASAEFVSVGFGP